MIHSSKEYYRITSFLQFLGFSRTKEDADKMEDVFYKHYHLYVMAEIENQDEDEEFRLFDNIYIHVGSDTITYYYKKFVALESGRLRVLQMTRTSAVTFDALSETLTGIFNELFGSVNYEFYSHPFMPIYPKNGD